ncbi:hypothetical protein [Acetobacter sp.]|nr:hypothetical protein [Acetobacter sp.]MCH4090466.1 hypothetical protein [Acetobacter sp.]
MAGTVASRNGAFVAALLYIAWLNLAGGEGGQSPVYYNFLMIAAMSLVLFRVVLRNPPDNILRKTGCQAMLLVGLALQIKYSAVFEGVFLGIFLLWSDWRAGNPLNAILRDGFLWCLLALVPTLAVAGFYYADGHGQDWLFANADSIFLRGTRTAATLRDNKLRMLSITLPLIIPAVAGCWWGLKSAVAEKSTVMAFRYLILWAVSACVGVILFGGWYTHYALPLLPPLTLLCAPLWDVPNGGRVCLVLLTACGVVMGRKDIHKHTQQHGNRATLAQLTTVMSQPIGCTFVYQGPVILYDVLPWCGLTNHPFPGHFNEFAERNATGMDPHEEMERILAASPLYVTTEEPAWSEENLAIRSQLYAVLKSRYHEVYRRRQSRSGAFLVVYKLDNRKP